MLNSRVLYGMGCLISLTTLRLGDSDSESDCSSCDDSMIDSSLDIRSGTINGRSIFLVLSSREVDFSIAAFLSDAFCNRKEYFVAI